MDQTQKEEIKSKIDIVSLIGKTVTLTKTGNSYRGATSATSKSGKSLVVDEKQQVYNNTATNDGGDVFSWIAYINNLNIDTDFREILEIAAEEAGVILENTNPVAYSDKKEVYPFLKAVAGHYHSMLDDEHRQYVKHQWHISDETIDKLMIGWCPKKNTVESELSDLFPHETIAKSGMVYVNNGRLTDVFKGRIMFPYWKNDQVVYFIGRDPDHEQNKSSAKYKKQPVHSDNYPYVSEVIDNNTFYGEDSIKGEKECYIVEGITDCIRCLETGIPCISPVTIRIKESEKEHAHSIVKNMDCVYICNDNEDNKSGLNGALDTSEYLEAKGVSTKIIEMPMPDGANKIDVAEYLKTHTKEDFELLKTTASNSIWEIKLKSLNVPENTIDKTRAIVEFINTDLHRMDNLIKIPFLKKDVREYFKMDKSEMNEIIKHAKSDNDHGKTQHLYFDENGRLNVKDMAEHVMSRNHYITMEDTNDIMYYHKGRYVAMGERIISKMVQNTLGNASSKHHIEETINYIQNETAIDRKAITSDCTKINLLNGVYDITTDTLLPHDPDVIFITQLPIMYNLGTTCPRIEQFMTDVMQAEDLAPIYEFIGYCMIPDTRLQKSVMLVGKGANGKSVLLGLLGRFIGHDNISGESLHLLENDAYSIAELYGKLVNVFPDLAEQNLYKNEAFKMLTGNEDTGMRARRIYGAPFKFKNTARLIFSANKPPSVTTDDNYAYFRRWMIFEFKNTFSGEDADKDILNKITTEEELSGLFNLAVNNLKTLLQNEDYSYTKENAESEHMYRINSDPIAVFANECVVFSEDDCTKSVMFNNYISWSQENKLEPKKENIFAKRFGKMYDAGRENTGERKTVWKNCACAVRVPVRVQNPNPDGNNQYQVDEKNESVRVSGLKPTCLMVCKKKSVNEINSPYGVTYRENPDGLTKKEDIIDMQSIISTGDLNPDGNPDKNPDGCSHTEYVYADGENIENPEENINIVKISKNVERYILEFGIINKSNVGNATQMIAHWSRIKPSYVQAIVEKLCKIA
ncbi:MAG: hypothetical protein GQ576_00445 [Methanococcoides sp.]|nr:hypothetical protein [Methanococcoides sp.]